MSSSQQQEYIPAEFTVTEFWLNGERRFTGVLRDITERQRLRSATDSGPENGGDRAVGWRCRAPTLTTC